MKRKLLLLAVAFVTALTAKAQFEQGKVYVGASLSGLNLSYNSLEESKIGFQANGGYMFADDWMVIGEVAYQKQHDVAADFSAGVGARYYIVQNGLYLGLSADYHHRGDLYDDFVPSLHVGYAFFLSHSVTIEPEIYYNQSFKNSGDYSTIGLRIGLGVYL